MSGGATKRAGVASSCDASAERAGLLAATEAAAAPGRHETRTVLVFASGRHAASTLDVVRGASEALPEANVIVVGGVGFATRAGEEPRTGVAAIALRAPSVVTTAPQFETLDEAAEAGRAMGEALRHDRARPMLFFAVPSAAVSKALTAFSEAANAQAVVGGGWSPSGNAAVRIVGEAPRSAGTMVAVRIDGGYRFALGASSGVVPLTDFRSIDAMSDGFVTSLGGEPPLEVLASATRDRKLVLALIQRSSGEASDERTRFVVRGIGGVDPKKKAIYVGDDVVAGDHLAFASPDAAAAREDFAAMLRDMSRSLSGGAVVAGFFIDCAGRGARLYGREHVDVQAIVERWSELPLIGIRSSFEVAPHRGKAEMLTYTGVLALLYAPS